MDQDFFDSIEIVGSPEFINQVRKALSLVKERNWEAFENVCNYVGRIQQGDHSCMWCHTNPPTFELTYKSAFYSLTWLAGSIVHEARHSFLYQEAISMSGEYQYGGAEEELDCIAYQIEVMQTINAPQREIDWLQMQSGQHGDLNHDGIRNWKDYYAQDW